MINYSKGRVLSFRHAFEGLLRAFGEEPNLKFHFIFGAAVIIVSFLLKISREDFLMIIFLIGFVIAIELTNTAIEAVVDAFTEKEHPGAKLAKDISAGAVLAAALTSAIIGIVIFLPYLNG